MRYKLKSGLVLLVAVCALSAVGVASASAALPEIVNKEGKPLVKKTFTGKLHSGNTREIEFDMVSGDYIKCLSGTTSGEITGLKEGVETLTLTNCEAGWGGRCKIEHQKGESLAIPVTERLVYLNKAGKSLAMLYSINQTILCGETPYVVTGSFLVRVASAQTNKLTTGFNFDAEQSRGVQSPFEYENEKGELVKATLGLSVAGGLSEQAAFVSKEEVKFGEEVELKG